MPEQLRSRRGPGRRPVQLYFDLAIVAAVLAVAGIALGAFALGQPSTRALTRHVGYRVTGTFTYTAPVAADSVYGAGRLTTGQPIYLTVVRTLSLAFAYRITSPRSVTASGRAQLVEEFDTGQGLTRDLSLQAAAPFRGAGGRVAGTISLAEVEALARQAESAAVGSQQQITLRIRPRVALVGRVAGMPFATSLAPVLVLTLVGDVLQPPVSSGPGAVSPNPFRVSRSGSVVRTVHVASVLSFRGVSLPVRRGELVGLGLLVAGLLLGGGSAWRLRRILHHPDERVRIEARHGRALLPVLAAPVGTLVEMASFDGLADLGRRFECPVLELDRGGEREYLVLDQGVVYRYRSAGLASSEGGPPPLEDTAGSDGLGEAALEAIRVAVTAATSAADAATAVAAPAAMARNGNAPGGP